MDIDTRREIEALRARREKITDVFVRECEEINTKIKLLRRYGIREEDDLK